MPQHVVYKYPLEPLIDNGIELPTGARVFGFGLQKHPHTARIAYQLWAEIDLEKITTSPRIFRVVATGTPWENTKWKRILWQLDPTGHVWILLEKRIEV